MFFLGYHNNVEFIRALEYTVDLEFLSFYNMNDTICTMTRCIKSNF